MSDEEIINSEKALYDHIEKLRAQFNEHKHLRVTVKTGKQRTNTQNAAMQLYCGHLAIALNDAGYDFVTTIIEHFKNEYEVPWTQTLARDHIWRPIQKVVTGHHSTTKPLTHEYSQIYDVVNRNVATKLGVSAQWPSKDSMKG